MPATFRAADWRQIRIDIDERTRPDLVASVLDLSAIPSMTVDAIWSSHNLEHLDDFEVPRGLREFYRVLQPEGFMLLTTPDLQAAAQLVVDGRADEVAYQSAAGPITPMDMIFGHRRSIEFGNKFMRHYTGFTRERLGRALLDAGFGRAIVSRGTKFDLWAVALMPRAAPEMADLVAVLSAQAENA